MKNLSRAVALAYGCLFLYSGWAKLGDLGGFRSSLEDLPVPEPWASLLAWGVPLAELLVVAGLAVPRLRRLGLMAGVSLLSLFTFYILYLIRYPVARCGCGGRLEQLSPGWHLVVNGGFILAGIFALNGSYLKKIFARTFSRPATGGGDS